MILREKYPIGARVRWPDWAPGRFVTVTRYGDHTGIVMIKHDGADKETCFIGQFSDGAFNNQIEVIA